MSERRRRTPEGNRRKLLVWGAWGLLLLLLGGNLLIALLNQPEGTPQGFLTPEHVRAAAFWGTLGLASAMSVLGMLWTRRAHSHSDRASFAWSRRGFVAALVGVVVIAFATFDQSTFPRETLACVAAAVLGILTVPFALGARAEARRVSMGSGRRRSGEGAYPLASGERPVPADTAQPER